MTWHVLTKKCLAKSKDHGEEAFNTNMAEKRQKTEEHQKIASVARNIERQKCINIVEALLIKQRETNHHNPGHAEAYPQWRGRVFGLQQALSALKQEGEQ